MIVGISTRVDAQNPYKERRDCLDQRFYALLEPLGLSPVLIPNGLQSCRGIIQSGILRAVLLSGGNDVVASTGEGSFAKERNDVESQLLEHAKVVGLPVLAVCRGFQFMNLFLGGAISRCQDHANAIHEVSDSTTYGLIEGRREFRVNSFHNWGITLGDLSPELTVELVGTDGLIEGAKHKALPWRGIMWHPERDGNDEQIVKFVLKEFREAIR